MDEMAIDQICSRNYLWYRTLCCKTPAMALFGCHINPYILESKIN